MKKSIVATCFLSLIGFLVLFYELKQPCLTVRPEAFFSIPLEKKSFLNQPIIIGLKSSRINKYLFRQEVQLNGDITPGCRYPETIGLLFVSNWKTGKIVAGELVVSDSISGKILARYSTKKRALIRENRKLEFSKQISEDIIPSQTAHTISVNLLTQGITDLALVGEFSENYPISTLLWTHWTSKEGKNGFVSIYGWIDGTVHGKLCTKAQLISYVWGWGNDEGIIYVILITSGFIWTIALIALIIHSHSKEGGYGCSLATGISLMFISVGLVYCILFPPFHAPDEPNHFLTYSKLTNRDDLSKDALMLANLGNFERIKFHTDEKISSADMGRTESGIWAHHIGITPLKRSLMGTVSWIAISHLLSSKSSSVMLFSLRLINIIFISICIIIPIIGVLYSGMKVKFGLLLSAPILLSPCIAFFSMGVSNYPFLIGGYVIQSIALGMMWACNWRDNNLKFDIIIGILIGFGICISAYSSDNGLVGITFWGILLPLYWFKLGLEQVLSIKLNKIRFLLFNSFFNGTIIILFLLLESISGNSPLLSETITPAFDKINKKLFHDLLSSNLIIIYFGIIVTLISFLFYLFGFLIRKYYNSSRKFTLFMLISLIPLLPIVFIYFYFTEKPYDNSTCQYVLHVLSSFFSGFYSNAPDCWVTLSFWGNFGWLDTPMPQLFVDFQRYMCLLGFTFLIISVVFRKDNNKEFLFIIINIISIVVLLISLSICYNKNNITLNSRYLVGPYLFLLPAVYEGYRRAGIYFFDNSTHNKILCVLLFSILCMVLHCTAWLSIIDRYF
ncbi:MAG: hypothetical protein WCP60_00905 [bacterium]